MSVWTKLAYGTVIAAAMAGGVVYHGRNQPSVIRVEEGAHLCEAVTERYAGIAPWPPNTNQVDGYPYWAEQYNGRPGWDDAYSITNAEGAVLWSFNHYFKFTSGTPPTVPLFGSTIPRTALRQSLDQIKALVPYYVERIDGTNVVYWSVTSLWDRLDIGDGTSLWTVARATNGSPVFGDTSILYDEDYNVVRSNLVWTASPTLLDEAWRALNAMTTTVRSLTWDVGAYPYAKRATVGRRAAFGEWLWPAEPAWYTVATNSGLFDSVPSATFQTNRGIALFDPSTSYTDYSPHGLAGCFESVEAYSPGSLASDSYGPGGTYNGGPWHVYSYQQGYWQINALGSVTARQKTNSVTMRLPSLATGVTCQVSIPVVTAGRLDVIYSGTNTTDSWTYSHTTTVSRTFACIGVQTGWWESVSYQPTALLTMVHADWTNVVRAANDTIGMPQIFGRVEATAPWARLDWTWQYR